MVLRIWSTGAVHQEQAPAEFYEDGIPAFVEPALESMYGSYMCTLLRFSLHYPLASAKVYLVRSEAGIKTLILFRIEGGTVVVCNELITLSGAELSAFAGAVFARYPGARKISLWGIDSPAQELGFPLQKLNCLEDISFTLPGTPAAYIAMLGKNMATKIKRFNKKLLTELDGVRIRFEAGASVPEATVRGIVALNGMRMSAKRRTSYHNEEEMRKTMAMVRRYGEVGTVTIGGELAAGIVLLRVGATWDMLIIAHDPDYDYYNLGTLCCYHGIVHAIEHGGGRFSFGWSRFVYKYKLLGVHTDLYRFHVYRTREAMLADARAVCGWTLWEARRRLKLWIADPAPPAGAVSAFLKRCLLSLRGLRNRLVLHAHLLWVFDSGLEHSLI